MFEELAKLKQVGSVNEFYRNFVDLISETTNVKVEQLVNLFVEGLKDSLRKDVKAQQPKTLKAAFSYAKIFESMHAARRINQGDTELRLHNTSSSTLAKVSSAPRIAKAEAENDSFSLVDLNGNARAEVRQMKNAYEDQEQKKNNCEKEDLKLFEEMPDQHLNFWNSIIAVHSKFGDVEGVIKTFPKRRKKDVALWKTLISIMAMYGNAKEALKIFEATLDKGIKAEDTTFVSILSACNHVGMLEEGTRLLSSMESGYGMEPFELVGGLGRYVEARFENPNTMFSLLQQQLEWLCTWEAVSNEMDGTKPPTSELFYLLLKFSHGFDPPRMSSERGSIVRDVWRSDSSKSCYGRSNSTGEFLAAEIIKTLQKMLRTDVAPWNSMLDCYENYGRSSEAFSLFREMEAADTRPTDATSVSLLFASDQFEVFDQDMYAKCGCITSAVAIFFSMKEKDVLAWNTHITSMARCGNGSETVIVFEASPGSGVKFANLRQATSSNTFKQKDFNLEKLGIGGLSEEFISIFRRAFASRIFPPYVTSSLGIMHVKEMLLYGPSCTGKTLMARQIGQLLYGKELKIANGPEVLSKFVEETVKNVRDLFAVAENEQMTKGDHSALHIIIFDKFDVICNSRGSTRDNIGVHDSIVNQLLTRIDEVESLNNILLMGMSNRKDLIDGVLLRPGRLEVHVEIYLPDENGRLQILKIHTNMMQENCFFSSGVDILELAVETKIYCSAVLKGVVKSALSYALNRQLSLDDLTKHVDDESIKVTMDEFLLALHEVVVAFGAYTDDLAQCRIYGMVDCSFIHNHIYQRAMLPVEQVRVSNGSPLVSCLRKGPNSSAKSALETTIGIDSAFPYVKVV